MVFDLTPTQWLSACVFVLLAPHAAAQHDHRHDAAPAPAPAPATPYAGQQARDVKSLSDDEVRALQAGNGMGLARPAELASYPGPRHVFEMADALALSAEQRAQTQALLAPMKEAATRYGALWIAKERELDAMFAQGVANEELLQATLLEAGQWQARVRMAHLEAHVKQAALLTPAQIAKYNVLRGYAGAKEPAR